MLRIFLLEKKIVEMFLKLCSFRAWDLFWQSLYIRICCLLLYSGLIFQRNYNRIVVFGRCT